jgi:hypothetical protein
MPLAELSPKHEFTMKNSSFKVSPMDTAFNSKLCPSATCVPLKYRRSAPWPIYADHQAHTEHTAPRTAIQGSHGSRCCKCKAGTHQCSKCYPQPRGEIFPKFLYLSARNDDTWDRRRIVNNMR